MIGPKMAVRRNIRVSLLVTLAHFVLTSLIGYYAGYRVGGPMGESIAHLLVDAYDSRGAMSEQTIEERYRTIKSAAEASTATWQPVFILISLPIKFALEPMFEPVTHGWNDLARAHELSYSQYMIRTHALILVKNLLNSGFLGLLVYIGLRIAKRSTTN